MFSTFIHLANTWNAYHALIYKRQPFLDIIRYVLHFCMSTLGTHLVKKQARITELAGTNHEAEQAQFIQVSRHEPRSRAGTNHLAKQALIIST